MKIFGFPLSPFVRKVQVALAEKGLEAETVLTNPQQPDEAFIKASPFRKIPAITDGAFSLADSTAIVTYLEAKHPSPALLPADPEARGRAIWFEEVADTVLVTAGVGVVVNRFLKPVIFGQEGDEEAAKEAEGKLIPVMDYLEGQAGSGWLDGAFSVGDIAIASVIKTLSYGQWQPDPAAYPKVIAWFERVCARPAWAKVAEAEAQVFANMGR
jgi:glutathione S-transferase